MGNNLESSKLTFKFREETNAFTKNWIGDFTTNVDRQIDLNLAPYDVLATMAHVRMLKQIKLINKKELLAIQKELRFIYQTICDKTFVMEPNVQDVYTQVELLLNRKLGEVGRKVQIGRSRNDQVWVTLKLYYRYEIEEIVKKVKVLFNRLQQLSEKHKNLMLPGYTHFQGAMPSSFGLWFGSYAESLIDDLEALLAAWNVTNKNPLGAGAGYGFSLPLNRQLTTVLMGFSDMNVNVVYAQMGLGKTERIVAQGVASVAATIATFAIDTCMYMNENHSFIKFPDYLTTRSSVMPHKKNPDVLELIRSRCNRLQALPNEIALMKTNLPSGYHKDMELLKDNLFPAFTAIKESMDAMILMLNEIQIVPDILEETKYDLLFSMEEVHKKVLEGVPFQSAYREVEMLIDIGKFKPDRNLKHTHQGSMGNLMNDVIESNFNRVYSAFDFEAVKKAFGLLM